MKQDQGCKNKTILRCRTPVKVLSLQTIHEIVLNEIIPISSLKVSDKR